MPEPRYWRLFQDFINDTSSVLIRCDCFCSYIYQFSYFSPRGSLLAPLSAQMKFKDPRTGSAGDMLLEAGRNWLVDGACLSVRTFGTDARPYKAQIAIVAR